MMFNKRRHVVKDVETAKILAEMLTQYSWTLCTGFRLCGSGLLFLNDSSSEDGAQEYAVVRDPIKTYGQVGEPETILENADQVETVTFGWMTEEAALNLIELYARGEALSEPWPTHVHLTTPESHGVCRLCA